MSTLEGAVVVVTGAGRGIGRAIAEELGQGGAKVVVNYSRSRGPAEELVAELLQKGAPRAVAIQADVANPDQAANLIEETVKQLGRVDVLVNNAGINIDRSLKKMTVEDWNTVIQVDLNFQERFEVLDVRVVRTEEFCDSVANTNAFFHP